MNTRPVRIGSALFLLCFALPAAAIIRTVPTPPYPTIQAGVNAALPGDTVQILAGEYRENVYVGPGHNNILIQGNVLFGVCQNQLSVLVDGTPGGSSGTIFYVDTNNVTIQCMHLRHGDTGLFSFGASTTVNNVRFTNNRYEAIFAFAQNYKINACTIVGPGSRGIAAFADGGQILSNIIQQTNDDCINYSGSNLVITGNSLSRCGGRDCGRPDQVGPDEYDECMSGAGITGGGTNVQIKNNRVDTTSEGCISHEGDAALIQGNTCTSNRAGSIWAYTNFSRVELNAITGSTGSSQLVVYGSDNSVKLNNGSSAGEYDCIDVYGDRNTIESNQVANCGDYGIDVYGRANIFRNNKSDRPNYDDAIYYYCSGQCELGGVTNNQALNAAGAGGFFIGTGEGGTSLTISGNTATNNASAGFFLAVGNSTISGNTATGNGSENDAGFVLDGNGNLVSSNTATLNDASGIEVWGEYNLLRSNTCNSNTDNGILIQWYRWSNTLERNSTRLNQGEGISNRGSNTNLISNTSTTNRKQGDCTNDGSLGAVSGNFCSDATNFLVSEQIN